MCHLEKSVLVVFVSSCHLCVSVCVPPDDSNVSLSLVHIAIISFGMMWRHIFSRVFFTVQSADTRLVSVLLPVNSDALSFQYRWAGSDRLCCLGCGVLTA